MLKARFKSALKNVTAAKVAALSIVCVLGFVAGVALMIMIKTPEIKLIKDIKVKEVEKLVYDYCLTKEVLRENCNGDSVEVEEEVQSDKFLWPPVESSRVNVTVCPSWNHKGIDLSDKTAPFVLAASDGSVVFAGTRDPMGYGAEIILSTGENVYVQYAHLDEISVKTGQTVKRGERIARMGTSGMATGVMAHIEVRVDGAEHANRVNDPGAYFEGHPCLKVVK